MVIVAPSMHGIVSYPSLRMLHDHTIFSLYNINSKGCIVIGRQSSPPYGPVIAWALWQCCGHI